MDLKTRKRRYSLIAVVMLLLCLAGCGDADKKGISDNSATMSDATLTDATPGDAMPKERTDYDTIAESDWPVKDNLVEGTDNLYEVVVPEIADTNGTVVDMAAAGDNVIALYCDKEGNNYLYEIEPYNMYVVRVAMLPEGRYEYGSLKLYDDEIYAHDTKNGFVYFYDFEFNKSRDIELPENAVSNVVKSNNNKYVYYYHQEENGVYQVDLITGEKNKLIDNVNPTKKMFELVGVAGDDQWLLIRRYDNDNNQIYEAINTATKEVILQGTEVLSDLESINDSYTVRYEKDGYKHVLCGDVSQEEADVICLMDYRSYGGDERTNRSTFRFVTDQYYSEYAWLATEQGAEAYLSMVDIHNGSTYMVEYPIKDNNYGYKDMADIVLLEEENLAVCAIYSSNTKIYVWDLDAGKPVDNKNNLFDFSDLTHYDEETEEYLRERAKEVGLLHDVEILIGDDVEFKAVADTDYNAVLINLAINAIEEEYYKYPEGMIAQLNSGNPMKISLVGDFNESELAGVATAESIALDIHTVDIFGTIHHETFHVIEFNLTRMGIVFDTEEWSALNPEGFQYTNSRFDNVKYDLEYFISAYAASASYEDRATIMGYVMVNNAHFNVQIQKEHINAKLAYVCEKMRAGFDTTGWPEETYWEKRVNK